MNGNGEQIDIQHIRRELIPPYKVNDNEVHVYSPYEERTFVLKRGRDDKIVLQNGNEEYNLVADERAGRTNTVPRIVTRVFRNIATGDIIEVPIYCPKDDDVARKLAVCSHFGVLISAVDDCNNTDLLFLCWNDERRKWFRNFLLNLANDHRYTVFGTQAETKEFFASLYHYGIIDDSFLNDGQHNAQDFLQKNNLTPTPEMVRKVKGLIKQKLSNAQVGDRSVDTFLSKFASAIQNVKKRVVYFPSSDHAKLISPNEKDDNLRLYQFSPNNTMSRARMKMLAAACLMMRIGENCTIQVDNSNNFRSPMNGRWPNKKINLIDTQNFCYLDEGEEQGYESLLGLDHYRYYLTMFDSLFDYAEAASRGKCAYSGRKKGIEFIMSGVSAWGPPSNIWLLAALDEALEKHREISVRFLDSHDKNEAPGLPNIGLFGSPVQQYIAIAEQEFGRQLNNVKDKRRFTIINYSKYMPLDFSNDDKDSYLIMAGDHCAWLGNEAERSHLPNEYWNDSSQEITNKKTDFCRYYMTPNKIYNKKLNNDYGFAKNGAYKYLFNELSMPRKARMWLCNQQQNWRQPKDKDFMMCEPNYKDRENFVHKGEKFTFDISKFPTVIPRDNSASGQDEIKFCGYGGGEDIYFSKAPDGKLCVCRVVDAQGYETKFNDNEFVVDGWNNDPTRYEPLISFHVKTRDGVRPENTKEYTCWCPIHFYLSGATFDKMREQVGLIDIYHKNIKTIKAISDKHVLQDGDIKDLERVFNNWFNEFYNELKKCFLGCGTPFYSCFDNFFELLNQPNTSLNQNKDVLYKMFLKYYILYELISERKFHSKEECKVEFGYNNVLTRAGYSYELFSEQWDLLEQSSEKKPLSDNKKLKGPEAIKEAQRKIIENAPTEDEMQGKDLRDTCITRLEIELDKNSPVLSTIILLNDKGKTICNIDVPTTDDGRFNNECNCFHAEVVTESVVAERKIHELKALKYEGIFLFKKGDKYFFSFTARYENTKDHFTKYFTINENLYNSIQDRLDNLKNENFSPKTKKNLPEASKLLLRNARAFFEVAMRQKEKCITKLKIEQINGNLAKLKLVTDTGDVVSVIGCNKNNLTVFSEDHSDVDPIITTEEAIKKPRPLDRQELGFSLCKKNGRCCLLRTLCYCDKNNQWFERREYFAIDSELYNKIQKHFKANNSQNKIPKMRLNDDYIKSMIAVAEQEEKEQTTTPIHKQDTNKIEIRKDLKKIITSTHKQDDNYRGRPFEDYYKALLKEAQDFFENPQQKSITYYTSLAVWFNEHKEDSALRREMIKKYLQTKEKPYAPLVQALIINEYAHIRGLPIDIFIKDKRICDIVSNILNGTPQRLTEEILAATDSLREDLIENIKTKILQKQETKDNQNPNQEQTEKKKKEHKQYKLSRSPNVPDDTVESIVAMDDDDQFPALQFLNQNGDVIATYDHYNGREFKAYKNIKTKDNNFGIDSFFVHDDLEGGKIIYIAKKDEGKTYTLQLSDNLYTRIMKKLPKGKTVMEDKDYYRSMCDVAKRQEARNNQNPNQEQTEKKKKETLKPLSERRKKLKEMIKKIKERREKIKERREKKPAKLKKKINVGNKFKTKAEMCKEVKERIREKIAEFVKLGELCELYFKILNQRNDISEFNKQILYKDVTESATMIQSKLELLMKCYSNEDMIKDYVNKQINNSSEISKKTLNNERTKGL